MSKSLLGSYKANSSIFMLSSIRQGELKDLTAITCMFFLMRRIASRRFRRSWVSFIIPTTGYEKKESCAITLCFCLHQIASRRQGTKSSRGSPSLSKNRLRKKFLCSYIMFLPQSLNKIADRR